MYEMLANHYFLIRDYANSAKFIEKTLQHTPHNKNLRRKLIICYTQLGSVEKALDVFLSLIKEDIDYIINTDPVDDDCPCSELIHDMEKKYSMNHQSLDYYLVMGILWLYCDLDESIKYLFQANKIEPENSKIKSILTFLKLRKKKSPQIN